MRKRWLKGLALAFSVALLVTACSDDKDKKAAGESDSIPVPTFPVGTTMDVLQKKGKINVGVKFDQNGFGLKNPTNNQIEGFDVEIAKRIAQGVFGGTKEAAGAKVNFIEAVSKNREPFIQNGTVDVVVATYTINNTRKVVVDFAGPYYVAYGDIMVKTNDNSITKVEDLNGKNVCTVKGSTYPNSLKAKAPQANVTQLDTYSQCTEALKDGRVVAETTDNVILAGIVQQNAGQFKLIGSNYTNEPYGIGLKKGDEAFRTFLNNRLQTLYDNGQWKTAYEATLGKLGLPTPPPPPIDRYLTVGGSTTAASGGSTTSATSAAPTAAPASTSAASAAPTTAPASSAVPPVSR